MKTVRFVILAVILLCMVVATVRAGDLLYVQVAEVRVRENPNFLSPTLAVLYYGHQVEKLSENPGSSWIEIRSDENSGGWVHKSALTLTRLVLNAGERNHQVGAGRAEPTLAGKGFSRETETDYQNQNQDLPFATLDKAEARQPSDEEIANFAGEGGLKL